MASRGDHFQKFVLVSIVGHVLIFLIFTIQSVFFSGPPEIYNRSVKVDLVALPDKLPLTPPATPPAESNKPELPDKNIPEVKKEEKIPVKKPEPEAIKLAAKKETKPEPKKEDLRKKQADALKKLKQLSAIEEIEKQLASENSKKSFKGNILSKGNADTGNTTDQELSYLSVVDEHFRAQWFLPEYLKRKNLEARVLIKIDSQGNILSQQLIKASGNPTFDEIVLSAIQRASPVPPPPGNFAKIASQQGFLFRFRE